MVWFLNLVEHIKNRIPGFNKISRQAVLTGVILFLCAASLLPLLLAGFYNHMSGDDWYNAMFVHEQMFSGHFSVIGLLGDIWEDLVDLYSRWSFTYTGYFLCYIMPAGFSENNGWMHTVFLLLCAVGCMYVFFTKVLRRLLSAGKMESRLAACLLTFVMIQYMPSAFDAFYWWSGAINNVVGFSISLLDIAFLIKLYQEPNAIKPYKWFVFGLALFLITGTNWGSVVVLLSCMILVLLDLWIYKKANIRQRIMYSICFVFYIACILFAMTAPGNARRALALKEYGAPDPAPVKAILRAYIEGLKLLWENLNPVLLLVILLACLLLLPRLRDRSISFKNPFAMLFVSYSIFVASFVPTLYAEGIPGEGRIRNIQYWYAVIFLTWNACYFLGWYLQKENIRTEWNGLTSHKEEIVLLGLIVCFLFMLKGENEPVAKVAMKDYLLGNLQQFDRELDERELLYQEGIGGDISVERLTVIPQLFDGYTDVRPDDKFWINTNIREYYHLKTMDVK
ncbi:MAG: hypothetical protein J1E83_07035 [Lachnospiraceae bacterium]|nr:hypothetical protein [Lachnospiraceae bacterium]